MSKNRLKVFLLLLFLCLISFGVSCEKEDVTSLAVNELTLRRDGEVCLYVNQTIAIVQEFVEQSKNGGKIIAVDFGVGENKCQLVFDNEESITVYLGMPKSRIGFPDITVIIKDDGYYWLMKEVGGRRLKEVAIRSGGTIPEVKYGRGVWLCRLGTKTWHQVASTDIFNIQIDLFSMTDSMSANFSTGSCVKVGWGREVSLLRSDVPNESYYKDIFLDAGYALTNRNNLPAASYLGLSMEFFSTSQSTDTVFQNQVIGGNTEDNNGRLLFPDGQPRYRLLFVVGGNSRSHGKSLREQTRERMREHYYKGGSYVGTCAGSAFVSNGYDSIENYPYYLHIWPYSPLHSRVRNSSVGIKMLSGSPLLKYYSYGGDGVVSYVRHNRGLYVDKWPAGAEILAWNDTTSDSLLQGKPAIWSYKKDNKSGRMVVTGSHPESYTSGERRDLMAAMLRYAIEGRGVSSIKGVLKNGEMREMDKSSEDNDPNYTKIGDLQYHHFVVYIPQEAVNVVFQVSSPIACDMRLMLSNKTIPYNDNADYVASVPGSNQSLQLSTLEPGLWYVSVKCNTTVTTTTEEWGQSYSGRTDVLNGVPYSIGVSWDELKVGSMK